MKENLQKKAGFEYLLAYKLTVPIYDLTMEFVKKYIDYKSRTRDQMEQAARSGMQNIPEGYKQQSLAGYIKLSGVSRGSLEELLGDYLSFARQNKIEVWDKEKVKREIREVREIWEIIKKHPYLPPQPNFPSLPGDPTKAVNLLITLIQQANYLIDKLIVSLKDKHTKIVSLKDKHTKEGGFNENLLKRRLAFKKGLLFLLTPLLLLPLLVFPSPASAATSSIFTISLWVNPTTSIASKTLVSKAEEMRVFTDSSGFVSCQIKATTWQSAAQATTKALPLSSWSHVVCTYDKVNLTVYVNGIQVAQQALTASADDTANALKIGQDDSASTPYGNLSGTIDEFKFYNLALTADQVKLEYNRGQSVQYGTLSDTTSGNQVNSAASEYCIPGDTSTCTGPVGEWKFEEGTGTTVNDISGNANTGTWNGTGSHWAPGKIGGGGQFDGSSDFVNVGDSNDFDGDFTLEAWFKPTTLSGSQTIVGKGDDSTNNQYKIQLDSASLSVYFGGAGSGWSGYSPYTLSASDLNKWHFVAVSVDYNASNEPSFDFYLDGVKNSSSMTAKNVSGTASFTIGKIASASNPNYFKGGIDQVRFYRYARSLAQIAWDYNRGNPVAWWKMDECQGTTIHDSSGNSNTGTLTVGATGSQTSAGTCTTVNTATAWYNGRTGKYNYSLNFDGTDDVVRIPETASTDFGATTDSFTVSAWGKTTASYSNAAYLVAKDDQVGAYTFALYLNISGKAGFAIYDGTNNPFLFGSTALNDGNWHHLVGVRDVASDSLILYVDGKQVNSTTDTTTATVATNDDVSIGNGGTSYTSRGFNGQVDDVKIFNYALTAAQVKALYNNGAVNFAPATGAP